jgi:hypothetical protein
VAQAPSPAKVLAGDSMLILKLAFLTSAFYLGIAILLETGILL